MRDPGEQFDGEKILFWSDEPKDWVHRLVQGAFESILGEYAIGEGNPRDHVHADIPAVDRKALALALTNGKVGISYMGWADCRICGTRLGTSDLYGWGFIWPAKAEHYVLHHNVWTPGCAKLLAAVREYVKP